MYQYKTEQFLPVEINEAWDFFSSPKNLSLITPPGMDFKILSKLNGEHIFESMKIDYTVKPLFGISLRWQTEIAKVQELKYFTDMQLKGPYKVWEHTHTFTEVNGGVQIQDEVNYQLPLGLIGNLAHILFVRRKIENIFSYRKQILEKMFISNGNSIN